MSDANQTSRVRWTRERAAFLAALCLLAGMAGGWLIHGPQTAAKAANVQPANPPAINAASQPAQPPGATQLKDMADTQAAPLIEKLKADPSNPDLLTSIGNLYYDAQQYPIAVDYYARALKIKPSDAAVRTDMGTAFWFAGNADRALQEFDRALTYAPGNPNTLFNRGLVRWKGKMDAAGATADWEKLLAENPNYEARAQVEQMLAEAKKHSGVIAGSTR